MTSISTTTDRLSWLFLWWQKRDPQAAAIWIQPRLLAAAQDGPTSKMYVTSADEMILGWAKADPQAALDFARRYARSALSRTLLVAALDAWPTRDRESRLAIALEFPAGPARDEATQHLLENWAADEPAGALARSRALPNEKTREKAVSAVLRKWSEKDAAGALAQYQTLGLSDRALLSDLVSNEARIHPAEAAEFLTQLDPAQIAHTGPEVVDAWAQSDPAAALAWALDHGVSVAVHVVLSEKVTHDGLERTTTSMGGGFSPLASALEKKPEETLAWIGALPAGPDRDRLLESAINAKLKLEQALQLFSSLTPEAAARTAASMAAKFTNDLARGEEWASALPAGAAREQAWAGLGQIGGEKITPPSGADRDAYLSGRVNGSGLRGAEKLDVALQISDPVKRRDVMDEYIEGFGKFAAKETRAWLDTAQVPEDWKIRWRATLDAPDSSNGFDF